jgi:hypothetical protein
VNKERKATLNVLVDVLKATKGRADTRLLRAVERGVEHLLSSEERAKRAMEGYKDSPTTAANYRNTRRSIRHLKKAHEALMDHDSATALDELIAAHDGGTQ